MRRPNFVRRNQARRYFRFGLSASSAEGTLGPIRRGVLDGVDYGFSAAFFGYHSTKV
jgi:hypothetical protein